MIFLPSFHQSLLKRLDAKNKFLRKFVPLVQPACEFARERDATVRRADAAEANARKAVQAELNDLASWLGLEPAAT